MKILVVAAGDPEKKSCWSGVPNGVVVELRRRGHEVIGVDYENVWWIKPFRMAYNRVVRKIVPGWGWRMFQATGFGIFLNSLWLQREVKRLGPSVDLVLAMSFCFDARRVLCPVVLIHDWTNGYLHALFQERAVSEAEERFDASCLGAMRSAKKVISLYPKSAEYIRMHIGDKATFICNPVNCDNKIDVTKLTSRANNLKHILCVGGSTYQRNVETVIEAANLLGDKEIVVDVVGIKNATTKPHGIVVNFYGYLDREKPFDKALYHRLYCDAWCFVNVRRGWCGGSSIAEALFCGIPVIASLIPELKGLYGVGCIHYCTPEDSRELAKLLKNILNKSQEEYWGLRKRCHALVVSDTYVKLVEGVLK